MRTGDRGTDGAIGTWLERHGVDVVDCADAFEACTFALTQREPALDLALVGADWLAPDELRILDYLQESWPGLVTIIYGSTPATAGFQEAPLTLVCRSASAVRRMLAGSPDALLSRCVEALRSQPPLDDGWRPQPQARLPDDQPVGPRDTSRPYLRFQTQDAGKVAPGPTPRVIPQSPDTAPSEDAPASHDILTQEELSALLEGDEQ